VRSAGDPAAMAPPVRAAVREIDPDQPLGIVAPLEALVDDGIAARRFNTWLLTTFGIAAIVLTAIGLYGLLAYVVGLRRHEMAVRLSTGATPFDLLKLIVRDVSAVVGTGVGLGLGAAIAAAAAMRGLLFGITPWDPTSQAITIGVLAAVALTAAWSPVRRAMRVDPASVLRAE
jgi:putative ABC transport system permease protein